MVASFFCLGWIVKSGKQSPLHSSLAFQFDDQGLHALNRDTAARSGTIYAGNFPTGQIKDPECSQLIITLPLQHVVMLPGPCKIFLHYFQPCWSCQEYIDELHSSSLLINQ